MQIKKDFLYLLTIIILIALCGQFWYTYRYKPAQGRKVSIYYNQDRELNKEIIDLTRDADKFVYFAVYTFTREDIRDALIAAKHRGLTVIGITDEEQSNKLEPQKKVIAMLRNRGIPVYEDDHGGIMHLKVMVTEKAFASGSYNWTTAATTQNDEVLEVGRDENLRANYESLLTKLFRKYENNPVE